MGYTWEVIDRDWLAGAVLPLSQDVVVTAFETVERVLGTIHVEAHHHLQGGILTTGTIPTLNVVDLGQRLKSLDGVQNVDRLIEKLKAGDSSASAELTAIHLLRCGYGSLEIEMEPDADVNGKLKRPDFRIRRAGDQWLYVEVTQPDTSDAQKDLESRREPLFSLLSIKRSFSIEIYLRRDPSDDEMRQVLERATDLCGRDVQLIEEVGTVGFIALNQTTPGVLVPTNPPDEPVRPVLAAAKGIRGGGEPDRQVVVRNAYSDERAEKFLQREAKQLPKDAPGMVMIEMSHSPGGPKAWEPLLRRRFQPSMNTRISGIAMFHAGHEVTQEGAALIHRATLLVNPHAKFPLASWVDAGLKGFPEWKGLPT